MFEIIKIAHGVYHYIYASLGYYFLYLYWTPKLRCKSQRNLEEKER